MVKVAELMQEMEGRVMARGLWDELEKISFAVSRSGHKLDAAQYKAEKDRSHAYAKSEREFGEEAPIRSMMFRPAENLRHKLEARIHGAAEAKHREGKNKYNPWGGILTPTKEELAERRAEK
jgi:hypothetical protein